jgi:hypothetical protein
VIRPLRTSLRTSTRFGADIASRRAAPHGTGLHRTALHRTASNRVAPYRVVPRR